MTGRNGPPNLHAFCLIYCGFQQVGVMKDCSKVVILMISRAVRMDVNQARGDQYDDALLEGCLFDAILIWIYSSSSA